MEMLKLSNINTWTWVRKTPSPPLFKLQREISGVLYLQRIAVIPSDTAILTDPMKTHADMRIPTQT
jgi:hypothetical protein